MKDHWYDKMGPGGLTNSAGGGCGPRKEL